jgi:hypothetical protein
MIHNTITCTFKKTVEARAKQYFDQKIVYALEHLKYPIEENALYENYLKSIQPDHFLFSAT